MAKKILIIDDEPELVKAVEVRLKSSGYEVAAAHDGRTGLDKTKEIKPDLVLLDIIMPIMDGYEVAKELMADSETKQIPIIVFTASQRKDLEAKCRGLGITTFVMKPFETKDLLDMIAELLNSI